MSYIKFCFLILVAFGLFMISFICIRLQPTNQPYLFVNPIKADKRPPFRGRRCSSSEISWIVSQEPIANSKCPLQTVWMQDFLVQWCNASFASANRAVHILHIEIGFTYFAYFAYCFAYFAYCCQYSSISGKPAYYCIFYCIFFCILY